MVRMDFRMKSNLGDQTMTEKLREAFRTFPLANAQELEERSNVAIPSEQDVEDAKEWVDFKEM